MFENLTYFLKIILLYVFVGVAVAIAVAKIIDGKNRVCKCQTRLDGRVALVTGGNTGIGLETARDLARRGAHVIIASRNTAKSKQAVEDIIRTTGNKNVEYYYLDLSKFSSVVHFAEEINRNVEKLHILVNNAGLIRGPTAPTEDGCNIVMQVNYISAFLLTLLLLEKLIASKPSRIVIVTSCIHMFTYFYPDDLAGLRTRLDFMKYSNSKLCQVLWMKALTKRLPDGVTVNALHPGIVKTDIFDTLPVLLHKVIKIIISALFKDAYEGAQTTIHLCVAPELENITGQYYKNCRPASISYCAKDDHLVEQVWKLSFKLTNTSADNFPLK